ncbi:defender against death DAD protein, partial [Schizophyllum commune Tattone D]
PKSAATTSAPSAAPQKDALQALWKAYNEQTPDRLKFVDSFLVFLILSGVIQFVYCILVTNFPFNAFLAGFGSTVGQFVLTASLRAQVNPDNRGEFKDVSPERCVVVFTIVTVVKSFTEHSPTSP